MQYDSNSSVYQQHQHYATAEGYRQANLALAANDPDYSEDEDYTVLPAITKPTVLFRKPKKRTIENLHYRSQSSSCIQMQYQNAALAAACMYRPPNVGFRPHFGRFRNVKPASNRGETPKNSGLNESYFEDAVTYNSYNCLMPNYTKNQSSSEEDIHSSEWSPSDKSEEFMDNFSLKKTNSEPVLSELNVNGVGERIGLINGKIDNSQSDISDTSM